MKSRIIALYVLLISCNIVVAGCALVVFRHQPAALGTALLAYSLGLRHAVDADHIAAIDNVTRKLIQDGKRPIYTGMSFAVGHSAIVFIVTIMVALAMDNLARFQSFSQVGGVIATIASAVFLLAIAVINLVILRSLWHRLREVQQGTRSAVDDFDALIGGRGLVSRLCRPLFAMIRHDWQMVFLGFLFGLGFDTASEITLLGIAATQAAHGVSLLTILIFPSLFAVGMALVDTTDGVLMLGAYEWAFVKPIRKLYYNMTITGVSALVALVIGGIEAANLMAGQLGLRGTLWDVAARMATQFNILGFAVIALLTLAWGASYLLYRFKPIDVAGGRLE